MRQFNYKILTAIFALICCILMPSIAMADNVEIDVKVVFASKNGNQIDEKVKIIYEKLARLFDFSSYLMISENNLKTSYKIKNKIKLPGERELSLTANQIDKDGYIKLSISISELMKSDIKIKNGGTVVLGGSRFKDGVLILVIKVKEQK